MVFAGVCGANCIYLVSFHASSPNSEQADARLDRILKQSEAGPANSRGQLAITDRPLWSGDSWGARWPGEALLARSD